MTEHANVSQSELPLSVFSVLERCFKCWCDWALILYIQVTSIGFYLLYKGCKLTKLKMCNSTPSKQGPASSLLVTTFPLQVQNNC